MKALDHGLLSLHNSGGSLPCISQDEALMCHSSCVMLLESVGGVGHTLSLGGGRQAVASEAS